MPTPHIAAEKGEIAERVLLPGDPLRAKLVAETFLKDSICYNETRGALGFTGEYKGKKVSIQATGMGQPSMSIYANELFSQYGVKKAIRIGTAGALRKEIKLKTVLLAMSCSTDSNLNAQYFNGFGYAPTASFELLKTAYEVAQSKSIVCNVGSIITSDVFYDDVQRWKMWAEYGCLAVEMESAAFYLLASKYDVKALSILTISDNVATKEATTAKERQSSFLDMMELSLETIIM
ncbi:MAG: purine-nucleoside phosphorylase [Treponema sp.]